MTHLEGIKHLDNPGMVGFHQNIPFGPHMRDLLLLDHGGLAEDLHGVDVAGITFLHQTDLPERAATDHFEGVEVVDAEAGPLQPQELGLADGVRVPLLRALLLGHVLVPQGVLKALLALLPLLQRYRSCQDQNILGSHLGVEISDEIIRIEKWPAKTSPEIE